jgi:hypothetical protein
MEKIPTMFQRDESAKGHPVMDAIKPECAWVLAGEGIATRKLDGMNVKIAGGVLLKRQKPKTEDYDNASYVPTSVDNPADRYLLEAFEATVRKEDGIYEAVGPKIQGNPEGFDVHLLVRVVPPSNNLVLEHAPRTYDGLRDYLAHDIEGIVFHHPDGRMAKIKGRDFGIKRGKHARA